MSSAAEAIKYAVDKCEDDGDAMQFLGYWNNGDFDIIRRNWPDVPEEVFADADPLHKQYKKTEEDAETVMSVVRQSVHFSEGEDFVPGHLLVMKNEHAPDILDVLMPDQSKYHLTLVRVPN